MFKIVLMLFFIFFNSLNAYELEDEIKVVLIGKLSKYIDWEEKNNNDFVITILKNPFNKLFDNIYKDKIIQTKNVKIKYIDNIDDLTSTNVLYIPKVSTSELKKILKKTENKNILTISDMRNFASRGGMIQILFYSQLAKLKINLKSAQQEKLQIRASLLQISDVIKGDM